MHWRTRLVQPQTLAPPGFRSLSPPVYRGSTVLFDSHAAVVDDWRHAEGKYTYGLYGTPTAIELGARIAQLEGALQTFIVPGGQAAITLIYLAMCRAGHHVLVPQSIYGPNRDFASQILASLGVEVEIYDPMAGAGIASLIRANTALIWVESPGSITMDVQDVPAICAAAHERGVPVALDNTYSAGILFDAFTHGVDITIQALTKYVGGHSDLLLGSVSVKSEDLKERIGTALQLIGLAVSPDDCSLALRGLQTMGLRLAKLEENTLAVAHWLASRPEIETVLHPALPSCPGHEFWKRDFTGSASVFSVVFNRKHSPAQIETFVNALKLFHIGMSWGGLTSLVRFYPGINRPGADGTGRLVRLNIGLEEPADLEADLEAAMLAMK